MSQSFKCSICDRPMPPHIYKFHLKKSHPGEEIQEKVEANEKEIQELEASDNTEKETVSIEVTDKTADLPDSTFDWGEVYPCAQCGEEYPAKAMPFHSWVKHRV